ncbi:hypothetical protein D3C71_1954170 [compost metagenome]
MEERYQHDQEGIKPQLQLIIDVVTTLLHIQEVFNPVSCIIHLPVTGEVLDDQVAIISNSFLRRHTKDLLRLVGSLG